MVYRAWRLTTPDAIRFLIFGFTMSVMIAIASMYSLQQNGVGKTNIDEYNSPDRGVSFSLIPEYAGYQTRVWEDVDDFWPYTPEVFPESTVCVVRVQTGFPLSAIQRRFDVPALTSGFYLCPAWEGTLPFELASLRPAWPGLVADTLFWGAFFWFRRGLWNMLRSRYWTRHARCPVCGYDRKGLESAAACPECGMTHPKNKTLDP